VEGVRFKDKNQITGTGSHKL